MPQRRHILPRGRHLAMPARDILRGANAVARRATARLGPLEGRLPRPLRAVAHNMGSAVGGFAHQAGQLAFEFASVIRGGDRLDSNELARIADSDYASPLFAKTIARGLTYTFERLETDRYLVSEVLSANAFHTAQRAVSEPGDPYRKAAQLHTALARHQAVGVAPGTGIGMEEPDARTVAVASFAVLLWMLIERDAPREAEDEALSLCIDVSVSLEDEIVAAGGDETALTALFSSYVAAI